MVGLYADENFELPVIKKLREKGYDILTALEAGNANQGIPDEEVLAFAIKANWLEIRHIAHRTQFFLPALVFAVATTPMESSSHHSALIESFASACVNLVLPKNP